VDLKLKSKSGKRSSKFKLIALKSNGAYKREAGDLELWQGLEIKTKCVWCNRERVCEAVVYRCRDALLFGKQLKFSVALEV